MTIQTLPSNTLLEHSSSSDKNRQSLTSNASGSGVCLLEKKTLYQGEHQTELQHLQAETEALLQQLQALKQQRLASTQQTP